MPLIEQQTVVLHSWLTMESFADIMTIAEMTPGPIALNAATFVGIQVAGVLGAIIATVSCIIPSTIIVFLMTYLYYRYRKISVVDRILAGVRPAVIALIASAGVTLLCMAVYASRDITDIWMNPQYISIVVIICTLIGVRRWKVKPIYAILGSGIVYSVVNLIADWILV